MSFGGGEQDHYRVLGVGRDASVEDIRKAFQKLAKELHPDANRGKTSLSSAERFTQVKSAYDVLKDTNQRRAYDARRGLSSGLYSSSFRATPRYSPFDPQEAAQMAKRAEEFRRRYQHPGGYHYGGTGAGGRFHRQAMDLIETLLRPRVLFLLPFVFMTSWWLTEKIVPSPSAASRAQLSSSASAALLAASSAAVAAGNADGVGDDSGGVKLGGSSSSSSSARLLEQAERAAASKWVPAFFNPSSRRWEAPPNPLSATAEELTVFQQNRHTLRMVEAKSVAVAGAGATAGSGGAGAGTRRKKQPPQQQPQQQQQQGGASQEQAAGPETVLPTATREGSSTASATSPSSSSLR